jgi:DNA-binding NarL/FixJ family response regulator
LTTNRILLADDHQMFLEGLQRLLQQDFEVVGTAQSGSELVALASEVKPDLIVTDLSMPDLSGLNAVKAIRENGLSPKCIILTMHEDPAYASEAIESGVDGYVLKRAATSELVSAIEEALSGGCWISPALAAKIIRIKSEPAKEAEASPASRLTDRQVRILRSLVAGKIAKEIAADLGISRKTVEYHKYKMMNQLELSSTAELIKFAVQNGLDG